MHDKPLKIKPVTKNYLLVLQNAAFFNYTLAGSLSMGILFAYISSASYIFLNYYQLSEEKFSALFAVNASGLIVGNFLNGRLTKFYHYLTMAKYASILLFTLSLVIFRSEEHTSELQSRPHLVCRLLLEKKKKILN